MGRDVGAADVRAAQRAGGGALLVVLRELVPDVLAQFVLGVICVQHPQPVDLLLDPLRRQMPHIHLPRHHVANQPGVVFPNQADLSLCLLDTDLNLRHNMVKCVCYTLLRIM